MLMRISCKERVRSKVLSKAIIIGKGIIKGIAIHINTHQILGRDIQDNLIENPGLN